MRRFWIGLATSTLVAACSSGEQSIVPSAFTRTFASSQCWSGQPTPVTTPCITFGAASHSLYVDSIRLAFDADNTVHWKIGAHRYSCPCYLGGCSTPCFHEAPVVTEVTGTYMISADTLILQFPQSPDPQASAPDVIRLYTAVPDRVSSEWAGPDSLLYGRVFGSVIIRSP